MREYPLLMKGPLVRMTLADLKTQTRRVSGLDVINEAPDLFRLVKITPVPGAPLCAFFHDGHTGAQVLVRCPYGSPGDVLWVRETWAYHLHAMAASNPEVSGPWVYAADGEIALRDRLCDRWRPSIHMPRSACRLQLRITDVRIERLQSCSEADAVAEGLIQVKGPLDTFMWQYSEDTGGQFSDPRVAYHMLWDEINGDGPNNWAANPWVWVVSFRRFVR